MKKQPRSRIAEVLRDSILLFLAANKYFFGALAAYNGHDGCGFLSFSSCCFVFSHTRSFHCENSATTRLAILAIYERLSEQTYNLNLKSFFISPKRSLNVKAL